MKNSFLNKILLTYSAITFSLVFVIFVAYAIYIQYLNELNIKEYLSKNFSSYVASSENKMENMIYLGNEVKQFSTLDSFAFSNWEDYYYKITNLYLDLNRMNNRLTTNNLEIMVHKVNDEIVVTNKNTTRLKMILETFSIPYTTYKEIIESFSGNSLLNDEAIIFTDKNIVYITTKDYISDRTIITVFGDYTSETIHNNDIDIKNSFITDDPKITDLRSKALASNSIDKIENNKDYNFKTSKFFNLHYYFYNRIPLLNKDITIVILVMALLLFLVCLAAFAIIVIFSVKLCKPIERIINTFMSFDIQENTNSSATIELDDIAQKVLLIRNKNSELIKKIDDNNRYLKNNLLYHIVMGTYDNKTVDDDLNRFSMEWLNNDNFVVLLGQMEININNEMYTNNEEIIEEIIKVIADELRENSFKLECITNNMEMPCFIINTENFEKLQDNLNNIISIIETAFQTLMTAFIGTLSEDLEGLHGSFAMANKVFENRNLLSIKNIYSYKDIKAIPNTVVVYPLHTEVKLLAAVDKNNIQETYRILDYIFKEYTVRAFENKDSKELFIFALTNTINRIAQKIGLDMDNISEQGRFIYIELKMCNTSEQLKEIINKIFENIFNSLKNTSNQKLESLKKELIEYIEDNISIDISLLDIAEHFNLSPTYMSYLFKSVMPVNFKDYISKTRYEMALKILCNDKNIKQSDLAMKVGINNVNTLNRIFKKYSGITLSQYIQQK